MLCLEDCVALCGLTRDEVLAIVQHEHIPEIAAAEMGNYLVCTPTGEMRIKAIIRDDIALARARGDRPREIGLKLVLQNFVLHHPRCEERSRQRALDSPDHGALDEPRPPQPVRGFLQ